VFCSCVPFVSVQFVKNTLCVGCRQSMRTVYGLSILVAFICSTMQSVSSVFGCPYFVAFTGFTSAVTCDGPTINVQTLSATSRRCFGFIVEKGFHIQLYKLSVYFC